MDRRGFVKGLITTATVIACGPSAFYTVARKGGFKHEVSIIVEHDGALKKALITSQMRMGEVLLFAGKERIPLTVTHILIDGRMLIDEPVRECVAFRLTPEALTSLGLAA